MIANIERDAGVKTGIPAIDGQHERIIAYINELGNAVTGKADGTTHVLEGLLDYVITQFEFEEDLQRKARYPFLKAHQKVHELFMKRIGALRERSQRGEDVNAELAALLKKWLASHIEGDDRDYVEYMRQTGGSA